MNSDQEPAWAEMDSKFNFVTCIEHNISSFSTDNNIKVEYYSIRVFHYKVTVLLESIIDHGTLKHFRPSVKVGGHYHDS